MLLDPAQAAHEKASAAANSSAKATVHPPLPDPTVLQPAPARSHSGSTPASLRNNAPAKKGSFTRLGAQTPAASTDALPPSAHSATDTPAAAAASSSGGSLRKPPSRQTITKEPGPAQQPHTAQPGPSAAATAKAAPRQTSRPLSTPPPSTAASGSLTAAPKAQSARPSPPSLPSAMGQITTVASQPSSDDWQTFLGSPTEASSRPLTISQRRSQTAQRLPTHSSLASRAVKTPQGLPSAAVRNPPKPPSTVPPGSRPQQPPKIAPTIHASGSNVAQLSPPSADSSRLAQVQASAGSLQDSAASDEPLQPPLLAKPAAKLTNKPPAAKAGHASSAAAPAIAGDMPIDARQVGRTSATGTASQHSSGEPAALTDVPATSGRPGPPQAAPGSHQTAHPSSAVPALADPDPTLPGLVGSAPSAAASAGHASAAPRAAPAAAPAPAQRAQATSVVSSKPASMPRGPTAPSTVADAAAAAPATNADAAFAAVNSHSEGPASTTAKPRVDMTPDLPSAPTGTPTPSPTPQAPPLIAFASLGSGTGPEDEDDEDFYASIKADSGFEPSTADHTLALHRDPTAVPEHPGKHSRHPTQQAVASQPSMPQHQHANMQARPKAPAREMAGVPTAVAPVSTAAVKAPSAASFAGSSMTAHSAAAVAHCSSSSGAAASTAGVLSPAGLGPPEPGSSPTAVETTATAESPKPVVAAPQQAPQTSAEQPAVSDEGDASVAEKQSTFVAIPFGGSAVAPPPLSSGAPCSSPLTDEHDLEDSFFDEIGAGGLLQLHVCSHLACDDVMLHGGWLDRSLMQDLDTVLLSQP